MPRSKRQKAKKKSMVTVIHNAPGKKGKQEYRTFKTFAESVDYFARNEGKRLPASKEPTA